MLERLARLILRHKLAVLLVWLGLTVFGVFSASQVSGRWLEQIWLPGYPAWEANQRTLEAFGNGDRPPHVVVFQADGDATKVEGLPQAIDSLARQFDTFRVGSTFSSGSDAYLSQDRHDHLRDVLSAGCVGCVERTAGIGSRSCGKPPGRRRRRA